MLAGIVLISNCCCTRLYLINSPVVRAETLKFQEKGVKDIIKDVFLPWYNAHRFLLQNIQQMERVRISFLFLIASGLVTHYFLSPCCTTMLYCKMQSVSV